MTEALNAGVNEEVAMIGRSLILLAGVLLFADARDAIAGGGGAASPESSTSRDSGSGAVAAALQNIPNTPAYKACKTSNLVFVTQGNGKGTEPPLPLKLYYCWDSSADEFWDTLESIIESFKEVKDQTLPHIKDVERPNGTVRSFGDPRVPKVRVSCFRWVDPTGAIRTPYYTTCVLVE